MPDRYINRIGVHQDELDKKFESTKFDPFLNKLINNPRIQELMALQIEP